MGGTMKGSHGHNSNSRRRCINAYVVMAIVCCVFVCVILGLMGIHRVRETSSLTLLIKEKDDQIVSLHLLLRKERERASETKRKAEEMRTEMARLGSREAELSGKVSEMRSTISSLREEGKAVESALQEKENEIRDLRLRLRVRADNEVGLNATMAETTETEAVNDGNGADRVMEDEAKSEKKEDEVVKVADDQGNEGARRFGGKHGYLRRVKGKRWRLVGKETRVRRSDGASTMADSGVRNSSEGKPRASVEEAAENSGTKMEGGRGRENEQLGDETTEDKNEHRRKGAAERNGEEEDGSDGEEIEDKEETDET